MHDAGLPRYGVTFAYGSNLDPDRMKSDERCPHAEEAGCVRLEGWRLEIFAGAADLEPDPASFVPAVAWRLTPEDEARLDLREGASADPPDNVKKPLTARLADGSEIDGYAYVMTPARRYKREHAPSDQYRGFLERGYARHGFPTAMLEAAIARADRR
jgi:GNAT superfamily N-acetyltransferase